VLSTNLNEIFVASLSLPRQIHDIRAYIEVQYYRLFQNSNLLIIHSKMHILAMAIHNLCRTKWVVTTFRTNKPKRDHWNLI